MLSVLMQITQLFTLLLTRTTPPQALVLTALSNLTATQVRAFIAQFASLCFMK